MEYVFKYRRRVFWSSVKVIGHNYDQPQNKMVLFLPDGSIREIANWSQCEASLGTDWVLARKKQLEQQSGQTIPLSVGDK